MLDVVTLLAVLDRMALSVAIFADAMGETGTEPDTVSNAARLDAEQITAINDVGIQRDLALAFATRVDMLKASAFYQQFGGSFVRRALDVHYGDVGGLNMFLASNGAKVHPNVNLIGLGVDQRNVFPPEEVDPVARYDGTGAGTGTFAVGSTIDTAQYGDAKFEVVVEAMGADARTLTITGSLYDGSTSAVDVVVPAGSGAGTVISVGEAGDRFVGVVSITSTGGTAADRLRIRSVVERAI